MPIQPDELDAVRDLVTIAGRHGMEIVLIGAAARLILIDWKGGGPVLRSTTDWDFGVRVGTWDDLRILHDRLCAGRDSPFSRTREEYRVRHRSGVSVDLVPFGALQRDDGTVRWPQTGAEMTVLGLDEAHAAAFPQRLADDLEVPTVTVPGLILLKLVAFGDRHAERDLGDGLHAIDFQARQNEERVFDEFEPESLDYTSAPYVLVGRDCAALCREPTWRRVAAVLGELNAPGFLFPGGLLGARFDADELDRRRAESVAKLRAFEAGFLDAAPTASTSRTPP